MAETTSKTISESITKLVKLKDSLIQIVEDSSSTKELSKRIMQLTRESKEDYDYEVLQTLVLMQDINTTSQRHFKSLMTEHITFIINSKIENYQVLDTLNSRVSSLEKQKGTVVSIPILGKVSLRDSIFFAIMVFTILVTSYIVEPKATDSAVDKVIQTTKSKLGVD